MPKFTTYSDGSKSITFSYTETTMTRLRGRESKTVEITPEMVSDLNYLPNDSWIEAARIFSIACGE
jgi:hypothetical protein